jgi:hypothetical protein
MRTKDGLYKFRYYRYLSGILEGMSYPRHANTALFLAMAEALHRIAGNSEGAGDFDKSARFELGAKQCAASPA